MGDKRKADFVFLLKNKSKTSKIELFNASQFDDYTIGRGKKYRIRVNGKWHGRKGKGQYKSYYSIWEIRDMMWRSLKEML